MEYSVCAIFRSQNRCNDPNQIGQLICQRLNGSSNAVRNHNEYSAQDGGIFVRVTLSLHATWLVNSVTHSWGSRRFDTGEDSRNSWWVALLTFGEGWHNNYHAHPTSARHGLKWYEIDFNWWGIRLMQFMGLARRIKRVRFNRASTAWQLVTGRVKSQRS